jgi:hypothetical protein
MAEVLTASGANCPILLDDSTVQSDPERTHAILDVLHDVSTEHQVIVFSQERDVLAWTEKNLGVRDQLRRLTPPLTPTNLHPKSAGTTGLPAQHDLIRRGVDGGSEPR